MPDLDWNKAYWDGGYDWKGRGEEWSAAWGGRETQWFGSLYPRIHRALPASGILEIAPGFGRWTKFLMRHCAGNYYGVDVSQECIDYCKEVFGGASKPPQVWFRQQARGLAKPNLGRFSYTS